MGKSFVWHYEQKFVYHHVPTFGLHDIETETDEGALLSNPALSHRASLMLFQDDLVLNIECGDTNMKPSNLVW